MDPRERANDYEEGIQAALDGRQAQMWTTMPGIVLSFNAVAMTASVQIAIQAKKQLDDGTWVDIAISNLVDCPVVFPSGGGFTLTFPVSEGDECLVFIASRCIDNWWYLGPGANHAPRPQAEMRMHDLSDGFILVGPRSQPRVLSGVSTTTTQLRSDDGAMYVELAGSHVMNIVAPGGLNITAPTVTINASTKVELNTPATQIDGNLTSGVGGGHTANFDGTIHATGEITANGSHTVSAHVHGGVQIGGSNTGTPTG